MAESTFRKTKRGKTLGSALLYVLILSSATIITVLALVALTGQTSQTSSAEFHAKTANYALEGALVQLRSEVKKALWDPPLTKIMPVGGLLVNVNVADTSSIMRRSETVTLSTSVAGRTYTLTKKIAVPVSPFEYAFSVENSLTAGASATMNGGGAMYVGGDLLPTSSSNLSGDLLVVGRMGSGKAFTVAGATESPAVPIKFPKADPKLYAQAADHNFTGAHAFNGYTFSDPYTLLYVDGDAKINGTFSGIGTIFVNGNVTIDGGKYATPDSCVAVICTGTISRSNGATRTVGMYFTNGVLDLSSPPWIRNARGLFIAQRANFSRAITVDFDPAIRNSRSMGRRMKLPGLWP